MTDFLQCCKTRISFWATSSYAKLTHSRFSQNVIWSTALAGAERITAVIQTVLIARALGMTEYGVYGFLFGTIGFVASIVGFQMGLTATVLIARYRETEKAKAALIIRYVMRFALLTSLLFALLTFPFATRISFWLLASNQYAVAVMVGCLFVGATVLSGVQDGVLQGFEDFRSIAEVRIITSMLTLIGIYPAAKFYGLNGIILVLLTGVAVKFAILYRVIARHKNTDGIPRKGAGLRFADVIFRFSLPSMLVSLLVGAVTWFGTFLLSRQPGGFNSLALVNTGLQWRGPILLLAASIGSVAIPIFSRYAEHRNEAASDYLQRKLLLLNCATAGGVSSVLIIFAAPLLGMYGQDFLNGRFVFIILVASTIPQVLVNVYMQNFVGRGELWRVLLMHSPMLAGSFIGYMILVPQYAAFGFAITTLASGIVFWFYLLVVVHWTKKDTRRMIQFFGIAKRKFRSGLIRMRRSVVSQKFGFSPELIYGEEFYDGGGFWKTKDTANKIALFFQNFFSPCDVLDIGCGPGEYLRAFSELGVVTVGCDGASNGVRRAPTSSFAFVHDLRKPLVINKKFDLVICVEVAEHIMRSSSATLVSSICESAKGIIAFTAAPPGCPGDDHINCRPIEFWSELFLKHGFKVDHVMTKQLRSFAVTNDLAKWWQEWSYIFRKV